MQAEKASEASEELAWPDACPEACEGELGLEQAVVVPATTAAAMTSPAIRLAPRAGRGRAGRVGVDGGLCIGTSSLCAVQHSRSTGSPVTRRKRKLLPCCNRPFGSIRPW